MECKPFCGKVWGEGGNHTDGLVETGIRVVDPAGLVCAGRCQRRIVQDPALELAPGGENQALLSRPSID